MKLPRDVDAGELIKALAKLGYRPVRKQYTTVTTQLGVGDDAAIRCDR